MRPAQHVAHAATVAADGEAQVISVAQGSSIPIIGRTTEATSSASNRRMRRTARNDSAFAATARVRGVLQLAAAAPPKYSHGGSTRWEGWSTVIAHASR
jgi:hypothetical protein